MHRFRKKSEAKRDQVSFTPESSLLQPPPSVFQQSQSAPSTPARVAGSPGLLPHLPPSDFRASVILPEFSQQFPVLRPGSHITIEDLKDRFAQQRARGVEHQLSEEEEDMILDALRFRSRGSNSQRSRETASSADSQDGHSLSSNLTASPSSSRSKRYSNNLFGSGRLRDYSYMRSTASGRSKGSSASTSSNTASITPTESSVAAARVNSVAESSSNGSLRPMTPEGATSMSSIASSLQSSSAGPLQQERGSIAASTTSNFSSVSNSVEEGSSLSHAIPTASAIEYRLAKTMDPAALKRASLALQEAIKELEDDTEDEIVLPRSHTPRGVKDDGVDMRDSYSSFEAGVAVTADKHTLSGSDEPRASPLPSRILPGYIPGMPRPMTPRDLDFDDRSRSTTPRATSPLMNAHTDPLTFSSSVGSGGLYRKESISATTVKQSTRPGTPSLFLQRSPSASGRHTPEDGLRKGGDVIELESPTNSSLLARRRPISPLSNIVVSASNGSTSNATSSRPGTPSNIIWQPSLSGSIGTLKGSAHARTDSWTSDTGSESQFVTGGRVAPPQRNLRSPPLADSPTAGQTNFMSLGAARVATPPPDRAQFMGNGMNAGNGVTSDVFSSNRSQRSPTPTQNVPRSPSSPGYGFTMDRNGGSRRSSRQAASSPWGFTSSSYPPPMLNLFGNSSRSSIGSRGSSYHSWEGDKDDRDWYDQILGGDEPQPMWHDLTVGRTDSPLSDDQAEELLKKYFGLTMADFATIQEKLVGFANTKGEAVRKRRPSTSQANYAPNGRVNSPPPQVSQVAAPPLAAAAISTEQYSQKANALLDSVVNDIQAKQTPPPPPPPLDTTSVTVQQVSPPHPSPGTKKNQSLADMLFGTEDIRPQSDVSQPDLPEPAPEPSTPNSPDEYHHESISGGDSIRAGSEPQTGSQAASTPPIHPSASPLAQSPYQVSQNSSSAHVIPKNETDLAQEIQAKMVQATATLKTPKSGLGHSTSMSRKRIDPSQIGSPQLVAHSNPASLETLQTIPSRSPSLSTTHNSGTSKIFKKLRGSLRAKHPSPLTEEVHSPALGVRTKSPMSSQTVEYDPSKFRAPGSPALMSATEPPRSKMVVPPPPASAGPGIKGFISRFRGKQRTVESPPTPDKRTSPQLLANAPPLSPLTPRYQEPLNLRTPTSDTEFNPITPKPGNTIQNITPTTPPAEPSPPPPTQAATPPSGSRQSVMIQQLFDAATNLGLDQSALNDLLMRSGSVSTRVPKLARTNSQGRSGSRTGQRSGTPTILEPSNSGDTSQLTIQPPSPTTTRGTPEPSVARSPVFRPPDNAGWKARENRGDRATSAVVRRTIILPDNFKAAGVDVQNVLQRVNSGKRRRGSVNSGSLKDRAPTPPPPRSPSGQRFSNDGSPPVPLLPQTLGSGGFLNAPRATMEKSNSTYDSSIYEMYANEGRAQSAFGAYSHHTGDPQSSAESAPALELIEYANGDTIWSIVSGLRSDEDEESLYAGRTSFSSEYSAGAPSGPEWENMQVTVKEHARTSSKGSYSSFALKNKKQATQSKNRPETKVFYSSTAQIGQLIENLSQGMDSGSFNFSPNSSQLGHSTSSSLSTNDANLYEQLEFMLNSTNRST